MFARFEVCLLKVFIVLIGIRLISVGMSGINGWAKLTLETEYWILVQGVFYRNSSSLTDVADRIRCCIRQKQVHHIAPHFPLASRNRGSHVEVSR